ncbi:hypothetical protein [Marinicella marina]|uniref:hypothetical protein n=1 Tax=Marinicella marina TaxID=2996016 RepID=UPI0024BD3452|nr:hypothetical protein [Marinicella marina]MDJ1139615.1 hypothetical protein [Marinicella marina]
MNIKIELNTDNSAFDFDPLFEVKRAIEKALDYTSVVDPDYRTIKDYNGNTIGKIEVTES